MPYFTPPVEYESCNDHFWGRFRIPVGQSVILRNGIYEVVLTPWLGEICDLIEGIEWFQGGRSYEVSAEIAAALIACGFTTTEDNPNGPVDPVDPNPTLIAYGQGIYGAGLYGG